VGPVINDKSQEVGIVIISIKVDRRGNVISASFKSKGSTITDPNLIGLAEKASMKVKFNSDPSARDEAFGTITYIFKVK
ncbi:MAG: energy transducer TonB, partial [Bacteroidetes bacterium]|nr:energy transducer TonB [Bacteroidota bacterium]